MARAGVALLALASCGGPTADGAGGWPTVSTVAPRARGFPPRRSDDLALQKVVVSKIHTLDDSTERADLMFEHHVEAVGACFEKIPIDEREPDVIYEARVEWANPMYVAPKPLSSGAGGLAVGGSGNFGGGGPPRMSDSRFTACVSGAISHGGPPSEFASDRTKIRRTAIVAQAYTRSAVAMFLTGAIGHVP